MEEWIGQWWHRAVSRLADRSHPAAAVQLKDVSAQLAVLFRALGGLPQWRLASSAERQHKGPRGWAQRLAGGGDRAAMPVLDAETLALPPVLAVFETIELNRELYLWLAGQGAQRLHLATTASDDAPVSEDWIGANLCATAGLLAQLPGWRSRYRRLVEQHLRQRPDPASLRGRAAVAEKAVQQALWQSLQGAPLTGVTCDPPVQCDEVWPVCLWVDLVPGQAAMPSAERTDQDRETGGDDTPKQADAKRRRAKQTSDSHERHGLMMFFRAESLLSWAEFVRVNRQTDDGPNDTAQQAANDMDTLSVAPGGQTLASRVRFDLDLPSASADDTVLAEGIRLPEWDHRRARLLPDHCCVQLLQHKVSEPWAVPAPLRVTASRMRRRLESLRALPRWQGGFTSGERLDMDAWVRYRCEQGGGEAGSQAEPRVYARTQRSERSLATLLLADLSLSTDAWATPDARVIDVIRDALYVFGQAMDGLGDPFEILGFSSVRREHVRVHALKRFDERWGEATRDRVGAIKPGYYTRMGAAIRYATRELSARTEKQRLLLILTDGKPNDLDHYEGRFGLEDTRHAVQAARAAGLHPFCITIDEQAADYLPYLFGNQGYVLVHRPQELVRQLTQVVATMSA
ncbi:MAG: VWA domain-containing protein [Pseudomonadota bacterium]